MHLNFFKVLITKNISLDMPIKSTIAFGWNWLCDMNIKMHQKFDSN